ncbi:coenzyme F420-0:L-glutamate ligase [Kineococcus gynurae]|uniref:Coenzyme F420-0:L-glutamate ligase n=1 Tax=Kineococcus gynurae TaxID=452979 RepID=A0ABV5LRF4_9ACTN
MRRAHPLQVLGLTGIGEVPRGADLAALLVESLHAQRAGLADGDVLVVSSKAVSKAAGLLAPPGDRDGVVLSQSRRTVAARRGPTGVTRVVEAVAGPVMAAAGVDASNVGPPGADGEEALLLLPADPDAAARELRARVRALTGVRVAIVVSDTAGRPWREGQTDFALGCAGLVVCEDLRGTTDADGRVLAVTARALADEVAAAADLVKGKSAGIPAALLRGLAAIVTDEDGPGAALLLREARADWFRLGHVEAVRAALGSTDAEPPGVGADPLPDRLRRVAQVAGAAGGECVLREDRLHLLAENQFALGALAQRVLAALWTEDLVGRLDHDTPRGGLRGKRRSPAHVVVRAEPVG